MSRSWWARLRAIWTFARASRERTLVAALRQVGIAVSTFGVCFALALCAIQTAKHGAEAARADRIGLVQARTGEAPSVAGGYIGSMAVGDQNAAGFVVEPLLPGAAPPPGLSAWMPPGAVAISPALVGLRPMVERSVGRVAAVIDPAGLPVASEPRVYLRPATGAIRPAGLAPGAAFSDQAPSLGWAPSWFVGFGLIDAEPQSRVLLMLLATIGACSMAALLLASRIGAARRARQDRRLIAVGASLPQRILLQLANSWVALASGFVAACLVVALVVTRTFQIESLRFVGYSPVLGSRPGLLASALLGAGVLCAVLVAGAGVSFRARSRRSSFLVRGERRLPGAVGIFIVAVLAAIWLPAQAPRGTRMIVYVIPVVIAVVTLPAVVAEVLRALGMGAHAVGRARSRVGWLVSGRVLLSSPKRVGRIVAGMCMALMVVGQISIWSSALGEQYQRAVAARDAIGGTMVTAARSLDPPSLAKATQALPDTVGVALVEQVRNPVRLTATCADLTALTLSCDDPATAQRPRDPQRQQRLGLMIGDQPVQATATGSVSARAASLPTDADATVLIFSRTSGPLDRPALDRAGFAAVAGGLSLSTPGEGWTLQASTLKIRARWVELWGLVGLVLLVLASCLVMVSEILTNARDLSWLGIYTRGRGWTGAVALLLVAVPMIVSGVLGAGLYLILPTGLGSGTNPLQPSVPLATGFVAISVGIGIVGAALTRQALTAQSRRWMPGRHRH